ncbi:MAG: hypothetical protein WCQ49_02130 [Candidatus Saccharibacteria bacterium]
MKRKSIAVDIDEVLALHAESFITFSNERYGTNLVTDDYKDCWPDLWGIEDKEAEIRGLEFLTSERIYLIKVLDGAKSALNKLKTRYDLYIVTARRELISKTTIDWINVNFPDTFKDIHFVPIWATKIKTTKAAVCKQIGADYLIDDSPHHCNIASENDIKAILFGDYSWNRNEEISKEVTKCKNWDEVLKYFEIDTNKSKLD